MLVIINTFVAAFQVVHDVHFRHPVCTDIALRKLSGMTNYFLVILTYVILLNVFLFYFVFVFVGCI